MSLSWAARSPFSSSSSSPPQPPPACHVALACWQIATVCVDSLPLTTYFFFVVCPLFFLVCPMVCVCDRILRVFVFKSAPFHLWYVCVTMQSACMSMRELVTSDLGRHEGFFVYTCVYVLHGVYIYVCMSLLYNIIYIYIYIYIYVYIYIYIIYINRSGMVWADLSFGLAGMLILLCCIRMTKPHVSSFLPAHVGGCMLGPSKNHGTVHKVCARGKLSSVCPR
jgi:hypothetical protein